MAVIQINVLGTSFALKADEDLPYLEKIRDYYKHVSDEIQRSDGITDQKQTAVLAGILIADELFKEKQKGIQEKNRQQSEKESGALEEIIAKLDGALK